MEMMRMWGRGKREGLGWVEFRNLKKKGGGFLPPGRTTFFTANIIFHRSYFLALMGTVEG